MDEKKKDLIEELLGLARDGKQRQDLMKWVKDHIDIATASFCLSRQELEQTHNLEQLIEKQFERAELSVRKYIPVERTKLPNDRRFFEGLEQYEVKVLVLR